MIPDLFDTRGWIHGREFFHGLRGGGTVSGWFKHIACIVHFISIIITSAPPQVIRHQIPEVGVPCSKESPGPSSSSEILRFCLRPFWQQLTQKFLEMPGGNPLLGASYQPCPPRTKNQPPQVLFLMRSWREWTLVFRKGRISMIPWV